MTANNLRKTALKWGHPSTLLLTDTEIFKTAVDAVIHLVEEIDNTVDPAGLYDITTAILKDADGQEFHCDGCQEQWDDYGKAFTVAIRDLMRIYVENPIVAAAMAEPADG